MGNVRSPNTSRSININILLLIIVGVASFIVAEQIITGWLPLGERINISRRDINLLEWMSFLGALVWGGITLWLAVRFLRHQGSASVRDYFEGEARMPPGILLSFSVLTIIGIISLVIALQILTGWLPLGERTNISRRDINWLEWLTILFTVFWGAVTLRTALSFVLRDRRGWAWGQWVLFFTAVIGVIILLSGIFDIRRVIPPSGSFIDNLPGVQELTAPALLLFLSCIVAYRYLTAEIGVPAPRKQIAGALSERAAAREVSRVSAPADQVIRNTLARSPGAGAIIGFIAIFVVFSVASDLFLEPASLAGALTTNITRGVVAIGVTMLMISGEFDLSVGSLLGVSGLTFLGLITGQLPLGLPPLHPILAAVLALAFTCFLGFVNGYILIRTGIPSFIVTLGTLLAFRAIPLLIVAEGRILRYADYFGNEPPNIYISRWLLIALAAALLVILLLMARALIPTLWRRFQASLSGYTEDTRDFRDLFLIGNFLNFVVTSVIVAVALFLLAGSLIEQFSQIGTMLQISFFDLMNGRIESLPIIGVIPRNVTLRTGVFWWLALVIIFQFILNQTRYGNATFAVGGNAGAARAQGINVSRVKVINFMLVALLVGIAAILDVSRVQSVDALRGQGLELDVIAASVIGGALLTGGYGSIFGALLGVFIFGMLQTGLVLVGMNPRVFNGVIGIIIIAAVVINTVSRRAKT